MPRLEKVDAFTGLVALAAIAVQWRVVEAIPGANGAWSLAWFVGLTLAFAAVEFGAVCIRWGKNAYAFSLMELPLVLALIFLRPDLVVLARVIGGGVALVAQRLPVRKTAFNLAMFGFETGVAVCLWYLLLGTADPLSPRGWLTTAVVALVTSVLGSALVSGAILLSTGRTAGPFVEVFVGGPIGDLANASFALISAFIITADWRASWLLLIAAAVLFAAYRAYESSRRRSEALAQINRFSDRVARASGVDAVATTVVAELHRSFGTERVELWLDVDTREARAWSHGPDDTVGTTASLARGLATWLDDTVIDDEGARISPMAVRLRGDGRDVGVLVLVEPDAEDLTAGAAYRQLKALAAHAGVALDNALRAEEMLAQAAERERLAMHDELTALPNRRLFVRILGEQLAERRTAVLSLGLDGFRTINETLGYTVGDRLLCQVADRLRESRTTMTVARFGGGDFALLVPGADLVAARAAAALVQEDLNRHFDLDGIPVSIGASIGIAVAEQGDDAVTTLHRADLATSSAKATRVGIEVYRPTLERNDASRLGLLADLRSAIAAGAIEVHYQPKYSVSGGHVEGAEALSRWTHPVHGFVGPDEFIPLAEQSSLITPLTMLVLGRALHDLQTWRERSPKLSVAVNISPRSLLDPAFVDDVARTLSLTDVPASAVTLEITESSLMADPEAAIRALDRLRDLGVRLSVDDLGTGYSSLAYLQRLPVDEVKIDRSFLADFTDRSSVAVVETIIELAHKLDRKVVAEGIEDEPTLDRLRELGCDTAQGYFLSRPVSAEVAATVMVEGSPEPSLRLVR